MFAALMVAMTRALSLIPGIPIAHTKLTWGFLARGLCALVCGPTLGLIFAFVEDILGFILQPTGDFFPGYTLSTMAGVLVYALCFYRAKITVWRLVLANVLVNLLVNAAMGSVWTVMMRGGVYWAWFVPSLIKNLVTIIPKAAVLYVLFQALLPILQRMDPDPQAGGRSHQGILIFLPRGADFGSPLAVAGPNSTRFDIFSCIQPEILL